jgi:hypothetical protein
LSLLLRNTIRWLVKDRQPVTVSGGGIAKVFAWQTHAGFALHVLNYTNPDILRGWFRETNPIGRQEGANGASGEREDLGSARTPRRCAAPLQANVHRHRIRDSKGRGLRSNCRNELSAAGLPVVERKFQTIYSLTSQTSHQYEIYAQDLEED